MVEQEKLRRDSGSEPPVLPLLLLLGRPAAGKSEIIHYIRGMNPVRRRLRLRLGEPRVIDDFPMLWAWFEEDRLLEGMGEQRLHTDHQGFFRKPSYWHLLIRRLELEYRKLCAETAGRRGPSVGRHTAIVEFSRGAEHGGYREALEQFSDEFLATAAVLYVDVSFEESRRKNRRRYNPDKPHSILEHSLPDDKLEKLYRNCDWDDLSRPDPRCITVRGFPIPYVVFSNHDDVTTRGGRALGKRLAESLGALRQRMSAA